MGQRREGRITKRLQVRLFGTDTDGKLFSQLAHTVDVSKNGVRLYGVHARIKVGEVVGLTIGKNKVHFRVQWVGAANSPMAHQIGLLNLTPDKPMWDIAFSGDTGDSFNFAKRERRRSPRVKCGVPVEIRPSDTSAMRARASDLSTGGCFVEMPSPLRIGLGVQLVLWLEEVKLQLQGEIASAAPGFGIGVRFVNTSKQDRKTLERYVSKYFGIKLGPS
jgi:hypothetical protein